MSDYDVAIIGSGPSGIAAATGLIRAGITNIIVFEREAEIGGIPRHTHHQSFGMLVFKRPMSGPKYIKKLLKRCAGVRFETSTTVLAIQEGGVLDLTTPEGQKTICARHIVLATGARETPRHGRLISGLRPQGIITTGALQQFIYTGKMKPFQRPVIVGTELVSFSALWTLRHAGINPAAMIEENSRTTAYRPAALFARLLGVPIFYRSKVVDIADVEKLSRVEIENASGEKQSIACDGVIFSGKFTGDNNLAKASHMGLNRGTQFPLVDQNWISTDPNISVIGNTVHPADMGDQCYLEGLESGRKVAEKIGGNAPSGCQIPVEPGEGIRMTTPNMLRVGASKIVVSLNLHVTKAYSGPISVTYNGETLYKKRHRCLPARRITLKRIQLKGAVENTDLPLEIHLGE